MITVRYDAQDMSGSWFDESSFTDDTNATHAEIVEWICDDLRTEAPEDSEIEVYFYDEDDGEEIGSAWIYESGWQITMNEGYRD